MTAIKRGIIGAVIGMVIFGGFMGSMSFSSGDVGTGILMFPIGALYGFGFAFGWSYLKSFVSAAHWGTFFSSWIVRFLAFFFAIAIAWIPGVFKGIKQIIEELR